MRTFSATLLLLASPWLVVAQQPNSPAASLTVNGIDGPTYPMDVNVRAPSTVAITVGGAPNAPYALFLGANGGLQPGALAAFGGVVDLPLTPFPQVLADGFSVPPFVNIGSTGSVSLPVSIPDPATPGAPPLGTTFSLQGVLADPTSSFGITLTAATRTTLVAAPIVTNLSLIISGGNPAGSGNVVVQQSLPTGFSVPFFGTTYTDLFVSENGLVSFGRSTTSYTSTPSELDAGAPRICGFWTDLDGNAGTVQTTVDLAPPSGSPYFLLEYQNVPDFPGVGAHSFAIYIEDNGYIELRYPAGARQGIYETLVGISPGNSLSSAPMQDLSALATGGGYAGGVNESIYEWFGEPSMPFYTPGVSRPFDLSGATVRFLPVGSGGLPGRTDSYFMF